jgi:hypothetical protein
VTNLAPIADAYVRDGSFANSNFGSDATLVVKLSASAGFKRESYLKFDLSSVAGGLQDATLQLQTLTASTPGTNAVALVTNDAWAENAISWTIKPDSGAPATTWIPQAGVPVVAPVTALAQSELSTDRLLSLRVYATNSTSDGTVTYGSRESGVTAPVLVLTTTNGSLLTATQSFWVMANSPVQPTLSAPSLSGQQFQMLVTGDHGPDYAIEASTNLLDWTTLLTTNSPALPFNWLDVDTNSFPQRFYRVRLGP